MDQVIQIARQLQGEYEASQKKNATLKSKVDLKQLVEHKAPGQPSAEEARIADLMKALEVAKSALGEYDSRNKELEKETSELKGQLAKAKPKEAMDGAFDMGLDTESPAMLTERELLNKSIDPYPPRKGYCLQKRVFLGTCLLTVFFLAVIGVGFLLFTEKMEDQKLQHEATVAEIKLQNK